MSQDVDFLNDSDKHYVLSKENVPEWRTIGSEVYGLEASEMMKVLVDLIVKDANDLKVAIFDKRFLALDQWSRLRESVWQLNYLLQKHQGMAEKVIGGYDLSHTLPEKVEIGVFSEQKNDVDPF